MWAAAKARSDGSRALAEAARRLNALVDLHLARAVDVIRAHHTWLIHADAGGCYAARVPVGTAYVFANHGDRYWFRQIDARRAPARIDFTPANAGWPSAAVIRPG